MFPSMRKGDIVENVVVIDVKGIMNYKGITNRYGSRRSSVMNNGITKDIMAGQTQ